jgi:hypothetical protein
LKLFLKLIEVACENAFVLWMLKYPNWHQRRIIEDVYICFLCEEMVTPHVRRADSGYVDRHIRRATRAMSVACKQPASPTTVKKGGGRRCGRCCNCPTAKDIKTDCIRCQCSERVCRDRCIKAIQTTCDSCKQQSY